MSITKMINKATINNKNKLSKHRDDSGSSEEDDDASTVYETEDEDEVQEAEKKPQKKRMGKKPKSPEKGKKQNKIVVSDTEDEEEVPDISPEKIRREIAKIFPSKYMETKVNADKKIKQLKKHAKNKGCKKTQCYSSEDDSDDDDDDTDEFDDENSYASDEDHSCSSNSVDTIEERQRRRSKRLREKSKKDKMNKTNKKKSHKKHRNNKNDTSTESSCDDSETLYSTSDDNDSYYDDYGEENGVNIVFNIGGGDDDYFDEAEDANMIEEDDDYTSEKEKEFMKESYKELEIPEEIKKEEEKENKKKKSKKPAKKVDENEDPELKDIESEYIELVELKKDFIDKLKKKPNNKILLRSLKECNQSINKLIKDARIKNTKDYHKLINSTNKTINEIQYFKTKLSNKEQMRIMNDLKEVNSYINVQKPHVLSLLESKIPPKYKAIAMQKLNLLKKMQPGDSEYFKIKQWVDGFMKLPFGVYKNFNVTIDDGVEVCTEFLQNAKKILDECTYGLEEAKMQIMQMVGQWITNPQSVGSAIAINGPMGTGKTSLIKDGVSKIFGRDFAFIGLGGATYSSFLDGHSYTYEGSNWGKIAQILMESKCMNPIIYFDELDKVSDTPQGQEIIGLLTHMTDTSQNTEFHDKYFNEFGLDLSKCLFIFSYNDENMVNPILRDRMYKIRTNGYDTKDKIIIAQNYLLPKIREQVKFNATDIIIPEDTLKYIIDSQNFTKGEQGVRNLKRCLEIIYTKLNLFRLITPNNKMLESQIKLDVQFPFTVTRKHAELLIKNEENQKQSVFSSLYI